MEEHGGSASPTLSNLDASQTNGVTWSGAWSELEWELGSDATANGETGPSAPHNMVADGVIGAEYRMQMEAKKRPPDAYPVSASTSTPQRDPYHGRTTEPKTIREPPRESFNVMVVGEAGLGKTTLLESFFKSFKDDEAAFALFERKETAPEIETRRQLAEAQAQHNATQRELQAAIETSQYQVAALKQAAIASLDTAMVQLSERLKELSSEDQRRRNELRTLRETTRALRLEMKKAADQSCFVEASELQLQAALLQVECDTVQSQLRNDRSVVDDDGGGRAHAHDSDLDDEFDDDGCGEGRRQRREKRALSSATTHVKTFDPFCISVGKHELQVTLVDTPGYGESLHMEESFDVICSYVDKLFERQLRAESCWSPRDAERMRLCDPLVHCCLYFIAPHRLKHIDIAFMRSLHKYVNIVPIIAKSDTMTTKEKEEFKMFVRESLQAEGIDCYPFDQSVVRGMEQQDKQEYKLPWAVIGSTDAYLDAGATVYLRKYPWGNALSSEPAHSDLPALRNLLMWSGQWHDLKITTRAKYEQWRAQRPLSKRSSHAIATAARAVGARLSRCAERVRRVCRAVTSAGCGLCVGVGVPPRYAGRALLVLVLALLGAATPPAVRWATGTDLSATRKLGLARMQIEQLVQDKARLVEQYERSLAEVRARLHDSQSFGELKSSQEKAKAVERAECGRQLRQVTARAELAEARLEAASDCTLWNPIQSAMRTTGAKVGELASRTGEGVVAGTRAIARDAPTLLSQGAERTRELTRDLKHAAKQLVAEIVAKSEDIQPVG